MKKLLVLGDYESPRFHPLSNLSPLLKALENRYEITVTENYPALTAEELKRYDACINFMDNWQDRGNESAENEILRYMETGGKMLTLHNGILTKKSEKLLMMQGGTFKGHEPYDRLVYRCRGICPGAEGETESFALMEEPYQYELYRTEEMEIFLEYLYRGNWFPAGWKLPFGTGTVIYLAPGHDEKSFADRNVITLAEGALDLLTSKCRKEEQGESDCTA